MKKEREGEEGGEMMVSYFIHKIWEKIVKNITRFFFLCEQEDFDPYELTPIKNGDLVHFLSWGPFRQLNSHDVVAPVSRSDQEVSGYIDHHVDMEPEVRLIILNYSIKAISSAGIVEGCVAWDCPGVDSGYEGCPAGPCEHQEDSVSDRREVS